MSFDYPHANTTPMMRQWLSIKQKLQKDSQSEGPIIFCRVGDFYELFYDDAERASKILDIQLTKRKIADTTYPMAGVPVRSLDTYVARLVQAGYRVAIIDQMEDAKQTKGTIKRELTRIVTRGTVTEDSMLQPGKNNYIASVHRIKDKRVIRYALAVCDLSTGDFRAASFSEPKKLLRAFIKYSPVEILHHQDEKFEKDIFGISIDNDIILTPISPLWLENSYAIDVLKQQFKVKTMQGFGFYDDDLALSTAGGLIKYLKETQFTSFPHISKLKGFDIDHTMTLDATAIKSLELFSNTQDNTSYGSLYQLLNETVTPMGSRLLRHWIANPLAEKLLIDERLHAVELFRNETVLHNEVRYSMEGMGDIERLITRISMGHAKATELIRLAESLESLPELVNKLKQYRTHFPKGLLQSIDPCEDLAHLIRRSIADDPEGNVGEGKTIKRGFNEELDKLRALMNDGQLWMDQFIESQREKYGLSIKIKQNNSIGYFIEVSKKDMKFVPDHYVRKQVMVNVTRYITEELKEWEKDVLEAEIKILDLEQLIYKNVLDQMSKYTPQLQITSNAIAVIDCLSSHAYLSERMNYCRPKIKDDDTLLIRGGRHPVIEALNAEPYVPNDLEMDYKNSRVHIITGPNFSGKSSYLRMTALLVIMAQIGSFVPASAMSLGVIDRIFTRIGASDNLVAGQSTFLVEMVDAANLVNNATEHSLIIADELGRGTSTYDGLAIAWSIAEYLHNSSNPPKTLIASHYHQLAELENLLHACKNYHFSISFDKGNPIFDHTIRKGSSDKSFGVEVARLAGLPDSVISRARSILEILESKAADVNPEGVSSKKLVDLVIEADGKVPLTTWFGDDFDVPMFAPSEPKTTLKPELIKKLEDIDPNTLTPMEALHLIHQLKEMLR
ncbi:MAG: DNA mismatch repair protein MutS [Candidatus Heimdallarchaeota archaeon]|nr:DNA mismatch repair protein MutS [Candidatus Heimdallarchaeota archaeon]